MVVLLDLNAAFDTVSHNIILEWLEHVNIKRTVTDWFQYYLSDRFQFVHVSNKSSSHSRVTCGVPQASVLGPVLFIIYMLPIGKINRQHTIEFYCHVGDAQLYLMLRNPIH